jgi:hypothetical protein
LFRIADLTNPILQPWTPEALRKVNARAVRATHPQGTAMMLDMYGTPRGPALHVVERYRSLGYKAAKEATKTRSTRHRERSVGFYLIADGMRL